MALWRPWVAFCVACSKRQRSNTTQTPPAKHNSTKNHHTNNAAKALPITQSKHHPSNTTTKTPPHKHHAPNTTTQTVPPKSQHHPLHSTYATLLTLLRSNPLQSSPFTPLTYLTDFTPLTPLHSPHSAKTPPLKQHHTNTTTHDFSTRIYCLPMSSQYEHWPEVWGIRVCGFNLVQFFHNLLMADGWGTPTSCAWETKQIRVLRHYRAQTSNGTPADEACINLLGGFEGWGFEGSAVAWNLASLGRFVRRLWKRRKRRTGKERSRHATYPLLPHFGIMIGLVTADKLKSTLHCCTGHTSYAACLDIASTWVRRNWQSVKKETRNRQKKQVDAAQNNFWNGTRWFFIDSFAPEALALQQLVEQQVALNETLEQKLLKRQSAQEDECIICRNKKPDTVIFPCRHQHVCSLCLHDLIRRHNSRAAACPSCRTPIGFFSTVYWL